MRHKSSEVDLKPDLASRKAAMPPSLSWKFSEKEFTKQMKDVKLFVKCIQAITLNHSLLLCGFASLREISMSDFRVDESVEEGARHRVGRHGVRRGGTRGEGG
jgi:hypothetical protein